MGLESDDSLSVTHKDAGPVVRFQEQITQAASGLVTRLQHGCDLELFAFAPDAQHHSIPDLVVVQRCCKLGCRADLLAVNSEDHIPGDDRVARAETGAAKRS